MLTRVVEETADELASKKIVEAMKNAVPTFIDPNEVNKNAEESDEMKEAKTV
jgi:flavoprotein